MSDSNRNIINLSYRCFVMRVCGWSCDFHNLSVVTKMKVITHCETLWITYDMSISHFFQNIVIHNFLFSHNLLERYYIHPFQTSSANYPVASIDMTLLLKFGGGICWRCIHQISSFFHLLWPSMTPSTPFPHQI